MNRNKVTDIDKFIKERIHGMQKAPLMWTYTREAFAAQLCVLLELYDQNNYGDETTRKFMEEFFGWPGSSIVIDADKKADDLWCNKIMNRAKQLMPELYNVSD